MAGLERRRAAPAPRVTRRGSSSPSERAAPRSGGARPGRAAPLAAPGVAGALPLAGAGHQRGGGGGRAFDLGLFGAQPVGAVLGRWRRLRAGAGDARRACTRGRCTAPRCARHDAPRRSRAAGRWRASTATSPRRAGLLLSVSVADCVPVFLVDARRRTIALVHAGWRGVAGGHRGAPRRRAARRARRPAPRTLWLHCGPAICGECYEVGPEVHAAVHPDRAAPPGPTPIDLRAALAARAERLGLPPERITLSGHCTRCGPGEFFSHRGGSAGAPDGAAGAAAIDGARACIWAAASAIFLVRRGELAGTAGRPARSEVGEQVPRFFYLLFPGRSDWPMDDLERELERARRGAGLRGGGAGARRAASAGRSCACASTASDAGPDAGVTLDDCAAGEPGAGGVPRRAGGAARRALRPGGLLARRGAAAGAPPRLRALRRPARWRCTGREPLAGRARRLEGELLGLAGEGEAERVRLRLAGRRGGGGSRAREIDKAHLVFRWGEGRRGA